MKTVLLPLILIVISASCKKETIEENEEEVITTMKLTFVPAGGGTTVTYQFDDADGPGGTAPVTDEMVLSPSTTYYVTLQLLNKTATPPIDITEEVQAESSAHRFYYEPEPASSIIVSGFNMDTDNLPLGITSTWVTGAASAGKIKITLRHYIGNPPDKALEDPVNSPKSVTDIDVTFTTKIQ